jgi:tetratricopeptide (TPR) repeat protein
MKNYELPLDPNPSGAMHFNRFEKIVGGLALAGAAAAIVAVLWPTKDDLRWVARPPTVQSQVAAPEAAPAEIRVAPAVAGDRSSSAAATSVDPASSEVSSASSSEAEDATEVDAPVLALAPDEGEAEADFEARAEDALVRGEIRDAFDALRKHLHQHPPKSETLLEVARLGRDLGEYEVAGLALDEAAKLAPRDVEVPVERTRLELASGDLDAAERAARRSIKLDKASAAAWNMAGRVAMERSQWERAEVSFRRAAGLEPTDALIHNNLGLLYVHMQRGGDAVESMRTAVELFGEEVPDYAFNNLGLAYELDDQLPEALDAFQKALEANPLYARAQANLQRVKARIAAIEAEEGGPAATVERGRVRHLPAID